jgi:hypothetical protein
MEWSRSEESVKSLYDKYKKLELIPRPFFQRNVVWADQGKSNFIESILLSFPIASVYINKESTKLSVIDGQQRLTTVFDFLEDKFQLKNLEKKEELNNKKFSDLDPKIKKMILNYQIGLTLIVEASKSDVIDMYSRINKYTVNLNSQELRKAAFHDSDFLELSEELAIHEFFEINKFFTPRKKQRMTDTEYVSELLCILFDGIQDKKNNLDNFYDNYNLIENKKEIKQSFIDTLKEIENIFKEPFFSTRFNQQADFYSLFALVYDLKKNNPVLLNDKKNIKEFLLFYDTYIAPESPIQILSTYAIKCVSQSNTKNSRLFRYQFLEKTLEYIHLKENNKLIITLIDDINEAFNKEYDYTFFENIEEAKTVIKKDFDEGWGE